MMIVTSSKQCTITEKVFSFWYKIILFTIIEKSLTHLIENSLIHLIEVFS